MKTVAAFLLLVASASLFAADPQQRAKECPSCAEWNTPQTPFRIFGNTYWVGTHGLGAILITSKEGHILIDGGLPESAPLIEANVRKLGFRVEDIRLILNSHAHFDHAGGIDAIQRASGAAVAASPWSARVLERGASDAQDPQYGIALPFPPVKNIRFVLPDRATIHSGPLALTPHFTPGHTPGGTTWTWRSCEGERCLDVVYADSQTPVSTDGFLFSHNTTYPGAVRDFEHSESVLEQLPCDVLLTPHPSASNLWTRVEAREKGAADALIDRSACRRFAASAREQLAKRLAAEKGVK